MLQTKVQAEIQTKATPVTTTDTRHRLLAKQSWPVLSGMIQRAALITDVAPEAELAERVQRELWG